MRPVQETDLPKPIEEQAGQLIEILRTAVQGDKTRVEARQTAWSVARELSLFDEPKKVAETAHQLLPHEGHHNNTHSHGIVFRDGEEREGRLATVSVILPGINLNLQPHHHPGNTIEFCVLAGGELQAIEDDRRINLHPFLPYESRGEHTVVNPKKDEAVYLCLRMVLKE